MESPIHIIVRLVVSFIILSTIFFYFDPLNALNREADTINLITYGIYAPFFFTTLTILICSILAVPFWFSPKLKSWWRSKPLLQISILSLGIILLLLSLNSYFRITENEPTNRDMAPISFANELISLPGWLLVAISILTIDISGITKKLLKMILKDNDWT